MRSCASRFISDPRRIAMLAAAILVAGCQMSQPPPIAAAPPSVAPREGIPSSVKLAVLDIVDERPAWQRGRAAINEPPSSASDSGRLYWYFGGAALAAEPAAEEVGPNARITGDGAFSWYPFPYVGSMPPMSRAAALGIADYLALVIQRRRLVEEVLRAPDLDAAQSMGAGLLLVCTLKDFASVFHERAEEYWRASDDVRRFEFRTKVGLDVRLLQASGRVLLEKSLTFERDSDDLSVEDYLHLFRENRIRPALALDQNDMPQATSEDMVRHVEQGLQQIATLLLGEIEGLRRPGSSPGAAAPARPTDPEGPSR